MYLRIKSPFQKQAADDTAPTPAPSTPDIQRAAAHGMSGPSSALPFAPVIQRAFGRHDVLGVRAFRGDGAAEAAHRMGARAFTTAAGIAFAGSPDLHTAAHEAAHIIQQRAGVQLSGGVGREGDAYERHADAVADLVVQGRSAESLLDRHAGPAEGGAPAPGGTAVQRKMGFEFESGRNHFRPALDRKEVVYEDDQLTLEADGPGTHMEFVTKPRDAPEAIVGAVAAAATLAQDLVKDKDGHKQVHRAEGNGWKRAITMIINDPKFFASPQHTEGLQLSHLPAFIRDYLGDDFADNVRKEAETAKGAARVTPAVEGLLQAIVMYIHRAQLDEKEPSKEGPKTLFRLMARTSFRAMFQSLTREDQDALRGLKDKIPEAMGLGAKETVFANPYISGFEESNGPEEPKPIHNDGPQIGEWLDSIVTRRGRLFDLMSPPPGIPAHNSKENKENPRNRYGMGAYGMDTGSDPSLALFEMRGHRARNKSGPSKQFGRNDDGKLPAAGWEDWARSIVDIAIRRGSVPRFQPPPAPAPAPPMPVQAPTSPQLPLGSTSSLHVWPFTGTTGLSASALKPVQPPAEEKEKQDAMQVVEKKHEKKRKREDEAPEGKSKSISLTATELKTSSWADVERLFEDDSIEQLQNAPELNKIYYGREDRRQWTLVGMAPGGVFMFRRAG